MREGPRQPGHRPSSPNERLGGEAPGEQGGSDPQKQGGQEGEVVHRDGGHALGGQHDLVAALHGLPEEQARTGEQQEVEVEPGPERAGSLAHRDLTMLSDEECHRDLRESRELLEDLLGEPVPFLAYPGGRNDARVQRAAARACATQ